MRYAEVIVDLSAEAVESYRAFARAEGDRLAIMHYNRVGMLGRITEAIASAGLFRSKRDMPSLELCAKAVPKASVKIMAKNLLSFILIYGIIAQIDVFFKRRTTRKPRFMLGEFL